MLHFHAKSSGRPNEAEIQRDETNVRRILLSTRMIQERHVTDGARVVACLFPGAQPGPAREVLSTLLSLAQALDDQLDVDRVGYAGGAGNQANHMRVHAALPELLISSRQPHLPSPATDVLTRIRQRCVTTGLQEWLPVIYVALNEWVVSELEIPSAAPRSVGGRIAVSAGRHWMALAVHLAGMVVGGEPGGLAQLARAGEARVAPVLKAIRVQNDLYSARRDSASASLPHRAVRSRFAAARGEVSPAGALAEATEIHNQCTREAEPSDNPIVDAVHRIPAGAAAYFGTSRRYIGVSVPTRVFP